MKAEFYSDIGNNPALNAQWDELLKQSVYAIAACRAEMLGIFHANFARDKKLTSVVVRDLLGNWVAGLPLVVNSRSRLYGTATSVANEWCQCGQLLLRRDSDHQRALEALLDGLSRLQVSTLWLDWIPYTRPEWRQLELLAKQRGWRIQTKRKFDVGLTRLPSSWSEFESSLSKNSRKRVRSEWKQLFESGSVELEALASSPPDALTTAMQEALEIEIRSWKGGSGTAIACHKHIEDFFLKAAHYLNQQGNLRLFLLRWNGKAIAFDLGEQFGSCYRSWKISYLPEYGDFSPGHVLNQLVIRQLIEEASVDVCDSVGELTMANRRWSNDQYPLGRIVLAPQSWLLNPTGHTLVSSLKVRDRLRCSSLQRLSDSRPIV